jgi:hypothetical protein
VNTQTKRPIALSGTGPDVLAYISALQPGELVIETGESCMKGIRGKVYESKTGGTCVMWDMPRGPKMGTSVTWGTRRISDI